MGQDQLRPEPPCETPLDLTFRRHLQVWNHVHDALVVTDLEGRIQGWNPAAERVFGWSAAQAMGRPLSLLFFDDQRDVLEQQVLEPMRYRDVHDVTLRARHRAGGEVVVALRLSLLRDARGNPVSLIGCAADVTGQTQAEAQLRSTQATAQQSHALLATLFRSAPVGLGFLDRDLCFVHINDALAEMDGIPAAEHLGRPMRELLPQLAPVVEPLYRSVLETRTPVLNQEVSGETLARPGQMRHWLASYYPVEADDGTVLGVGVVVIEVTERRQAQEAMRRERDFAEGLIDTAQAIVLVLDPQGRIIRFNRFMEKLSGYRLDEVRGKDWFETFLPQRDRQRIWRRYEQLQRKVETHGDILPILTKDGAERQISWWDRRLTDVHGNTLGLLCVGHDITDLLESQQRALRSERLAAIGQTVTTIAHESRNELAAIALGENVLADFVSIDPDVERPVRLIRESRSRLERLLDDLRNFAAPIQLQRTRCELSQLWRRAWESVATQRGGRRCTLTEQIHAGTLACTADAMRIEQLFRNLFDNALASCPDPVEIQVECCQFQEGSSEFLSVAVRDNGPGLNADARAKAFDPFFTTKPYGTGLGLAIAQRTIEAHGGRIAVGNPDRGAEFLITLPRQP